MNKRLFFLCLFLATMLVAFGQNETDKKISDSEKMALTQNTNNLERVVFEDLSIADFEQKISTLNHFTLVVQGHELYVKEVNYDSVDKGSNGYVLKESDGNYAIINFSNEAVGVWFYSDSFDANIFRDANGIKFYESDKTSNANARCQVREFNEQRSTRSNQVDYRSGDLCNEPCSGLSTIRVLIAFDVNKFDLVALRLQVNKEIMWGNMANLNSGVNMKFEIAGYVHIDYSNDNNTEQLLGHLKDDKYSSILRREMKNKDADLLSVIVPNEFGGAIGIAKRPKEVALNNFRSYDSYIGGKLCCKVWSFSATTFSYT